MRPANIRLANDAVDIDPDIKTNEFLKSSLLACSLSVVILVNCLINSNDKANIEAKKPTTIA